MARHGISPLTPPIILALELATLYGSIALVGAQTTIYEQSHYSQKTHSKRLLSQIDTALHSTGIDWPQIDGLAISIGPGSFTGLRIALSTAKGLVFALNKKLIGIPTLDGLAHQVPSTTKQICPLLDARKQEVYTALYQYDERQKLHKKTTDQVLSPDKLISHITQPTLFVGDGLILYKKLLAERLGPLCSFASPEVIFPRAATIGKLAIGKYLLGDFIHADSATPLYVRASDAELNFG